MSFNQITSAMEIELGPFSSLEMSQTPMNSKTQIPDIISTWLDTDDIYTPSFPNESHDVQMLSDHLFQLASSDFESDPFSLLPRTDDNSESLLLDLCDFVSEPQLDNDMYYPILPEFSAILEASTDQAAVVEEDESDQFFNDNPFLIAPAESNESFADQLHASVSTTATKETNAATVDECLQISKTSVEVPQNQEDDEDEEEMDDNAKPGTLNCKNLVSERNRRKRLSQQLLALRALVPNITKMDKRSVLVDALAYLRSIHEETKRLQRELKESSSSKNNLESFVDDTPEQTLQPTLTLAPRPSISKSKSQILEIDAEKIEERRFVVKINSKGGAGVGGEVLRVIESLGFEISYTALEQIKPLHVLTTVFIRVRKQGRMTEEKLKDCITSTALRSGLMLQNP
ncbi:transcription factor MYC4-like isoform X2 [Magnolia sinica]|uniref:transcription factor MYC4-like isoform X2 n=1 Tax=Magnolia sinica TaxID=86752 RepID=UPI002657E4C0|nr:transcription factor MYC4-like isoform X2 [Magnolia sinica]